MVGWKGWVRLSSTEGPEDHSLHRQHLPRFLTLGVLICLAFASHLIRIQAQSLWWDETLSYHRAARDLPYVLSNAISFADIVTTDQHPPLYFLAIHFALVLFGQSEFALRLPSAMFTVLAVPLSYVMGRRILDEDVGLVTALLAAISPYYLYYGQEARPYALVIALGTASAYLLVRALQKGKAWPWGVYFLVASASILTHYLTIVMILVEAAYVAVYLLLRRRVKTVFALGGFAVLAVLLFPVAQYAFFRLTVLGDSSLQAPLTDVLRDLGISFGFGITVNQFDVLPYALGLAAIALCGVIACFATHKSDAFLFILARFGLPIGIFYLVSQYRAVYNTRYTAFLAPIFYLLLAAGIVWILRRSRYVGALVCLYVVAIGAFGTYSYFALNGDFKANFRDAIRYIVRQANPDDAIVLGDPRILTAFEFYYRGDQPIYPIPARYGEARPDVVSAKLGDIARNHRRIWFMLWTSSDMDPQGLTAKTLDSQYWKLDDRLFVGREYAITVRLYSTKSFTVERPPDTAIPVDVRFGNQLRLVAYHVGLEDRGTQRVKVTLYWRPEQPGLPRYGVFGQLTDAEGAAWGAFDGEPYRGIHPTSSWEQGTIVADERELNPTPGAPPGKYTLRLGVRDSNGNVIAAKVDGGESRSYVELAGPNLPATPLTGSSELALVRRYDADFAGQVVLIGSDLQQKVLRPGEQFDLRLFWQARERLQADLSIALTMVDSAGRGELLIEQPISRLYPSSLWQPGELVGASYKIKIPPEAQNGRHTLHLSLMRSDGTGNLKVHSGLGISPSDALELAPLDVQALERTYHNLPMDHRLDIALEDINALGFTSNPAALTGAREEDNGLPVLVLPSPWIDPLAVTLFWQPSRDIQQDYKVSVQLLDADGRLVDQHDGRPQRDARPTTNWIAGEIIEDTHDLSGLREMMPGTYTLIVVIYDAITEKRLPLADRKGDHIELCRVVIQP